MCVISFVGQHYQEVWPAVWPTTGPAPTTAPVVTWPNVPNVQPLETNWTSTTLTSTEKTALEAFEELMAAAKKLDAILGLPDCEDPKKYEWLDSVRESVRQHEVAKIEKRLER